LIFSSRCAVGEDSATRVRREAMREEWLPKPYLFALQGDPNCWGLQDIECV
jgi:hypothetical protein